MKLRFFGVIFGGLTFAFTSSTGTLDFHRRMYRDTVRRDMDVLRAISETHVTPLSYISVISL